MLPIPFKSHLILHVEILSLCLVFTVSYRVHRSFHERLKKYYKSEFFFLYGLLCFCFKRNELIHGISENFVENPFLLGWLWVLPNDFGTKVRIFSLGFFGFYSQSLWKLCSGFSPESSWGTEFSITSLTSCQCLYKSLP